MTEPEILREAARILAARAMELRADAISLEAGFEQDRAHEEASKHEVASHHLAATAARDYIEAHVVPPDGSKRRGAAGLAWALRSADLDRHGRGSTNEFPAAPTEDR